MTILVTGAAGFVGSHLVGALMDRGEHVLGLDIVPSPAKSPNLTDAFLQLGPKPPFVFNYYHVNVADPDDMSRSWPRGVTHVYHLASVVGIPNYMADPLATIDTIVNGTRNVARLAADLGARMVHLSTSEIYGRNPRVPWTEHADRVLGQTDIDRWCYSSAKATAEHILYAMRDNLDFTIIRPFNVYGPRQAPIFAVSQMVHAVLNGESIEVHGDGRQTRAFTYVGDAVGAIIAAGASPAARGQAFNIGATIETSINDLAQAVLKIVPSSHRPAIKHVGERHASGYEDVARRVPDATKALLALGWQATTSLEDGLQVTIDWARENPWWLGKRAAA